MILRFLDVLDNAPHTLTPEVKSIFVSVIITFIILMIKTAYNENEHNS